MLFLGIVQNFIIRRHMGKEAAKDEVATLLLLLKIRRLPGYFLAVSMLLQTLLALALLPLVFNG